MTFTRSLFTVWGTCKNSAKYRSFRRGVVFSVGNKRSVKTFRYCQAVRLHRCLHARFQHPDSMKHCALWLCQHDPPRLDLVPTGAMSKADIARWGCQTSHNAGYKACFQIAKPVNK